MTEQPDHGQTDPSVDEPEVAAADEPEASPEGEAPAAGADDSVERQLAERTLDLQRLQAEYVNYKRRVDRDRELMRKQGREDVLVALLTVLDDIGRAEEHGELTGGFKAVADSLQAAVAKYELEAFGAPGDPFDPALHEAVFHAGESADVDTTSVAQVMRIGYKVGDKVVRAATVGVVDPADDQPTEADNDDNDEQ
ncbi:nucleotide exchange factor GrpE [Aeromicrobium sp. PE09-221]|uniref:nucleotide exchange factor GrpE n=1 Tax=Aeromicrobium sp. PE09-221 TaxID=1898043 RepID=UPI000B3E475F|nr:nucleotide exchange factor GrpE [Aeromicrobium sp. PE09-221]OUZ07667.1 nucleotide exchange factor GrpE [Aeromicrobium sp. PE09-221]